MRGLVGLLAVVVACGGNSNGDGDAGGGGEGSNSATTVMVTLEHRPTDAAMFTFLAAYQDGDGAWMAAPAPTGDTYALPITGATYSFAWTCIANAVVPGAGLTQLRQVVITRFAVSERLSLTLEVPPRCSDRAGNIALTGNVSNLGAGGSFLIAFGDRIAVVNPANGNYQLMTPPGTRDLVVIRIQNGVGPTERVADRAAIQRGLSVQAATTANIDFSTSAATQSFPVTIGATGRVAASTTLYAGGTELELVQLITTPYESRALAASQAAGGDLYDQSMSATAMGQTAIVSVTTSTPAAQTWSAPAGLGGATATIPTSTPYPQVMTTWPPYPSAVGYALQVTQQPTQVQCGTATPCAVLWTTLLSPGAVGAAPGYQMPDLSAVAGWSANLAPATGTMITGFAQAMTSSNGGSDFPFASPPINGTEHIVVRSDYTVMP